MSFTQSSAAYAAYDRKSETQEWWTSTEGMRLKERKGLFGQKSPSLSKSHNSQLTAIPTSVQVFEPPLRGTRGTKSLVLPLPTRATMARGGNEPVAVFCVGLGAIQPEWRSHPQINPRAPLRPKGALREPLSCVCSGWDKQQGP